MVTLYGIPNCNTVKKARDWLKENGVEYQFQDFKKQGVDTTFLARAVDVFGWEKVLNRAGMTWRRLSEEEKATVSDRESAIQLMKEKPSIIKRPILETDALQALGFKEEEYSQLFNKAA